MFEFVFLCLGIFITSIFWWSRAPVPFEVPKVIFFQWFVRVLALVFAVSFFLRKKSWKINLKLLIIILVFVAWITIASLFGSDISKSFAGNYFRIDGLITFYELIGFSVLVSYFWNDKFRKIISLTFFASSTLLSVLATHKFGLGSAATFGNPVFLAGYLAVSIPFSFYLFKSTKHRIYLLGLTIQSLAIILTGAVSSILTLIVFAFVYLLFFQKRIAKFLLIPLAVIFLLILISWSRNYFYIKNPTTLSYESRQRIFQNVIRGAVKKPVLGYGWANVDYAFNAGGWPIKFANDVYVDKAHSEILEVFVTTGIPGLLIYLSFLFVFVKTLIVRYKGPGDKVWNFTLLSVILLYLFHSQTNVISICEEIIFWMVLGITIKSFGFAKSPVRQASHGRRC